VIDAAYLSRKLPAMGIVRGDILFVHSAFSAVGGMEGGVDGFIDGLLQAVGPEGTLIFPTFTSYTQPFSRGGSPSNTGILSDVFRKRPGVVRTLHPSHSIAAIGRQAKYFAQDEWILNTTCGAGTCYMRLSEQGAKVMMLGVDLNRCTMLHACEDMADLNYLVPEVKAAAPEGQTGKMIMKRFPPGHRAFIHLMETLRCETWFTVGYIGEARTLIFPAAEMYDFCMEKLKDDPFLFLCENASCNSCMLMRARPISAAVCPDRHCEVCAFTKELQ